MDSSAHTATVQARYRAGSSDTRADIVLTSERWFKRVGFRKTTIADVAAELGMSPANVYRFFSSKAALNEAVAERVLNEIASELRCVSKRADLSPPERLSAFLHSWARTTSQVLGTDAHIHEMVEAAMSESWAACIAHKHEIDRQIADIVAEGIAAGYFETASVVDSARCARNAMLRYVHPFMTECNDGSPDVGRMIAFVLRALSAADAQRPSP